MVGAAVQENTFYSKALLVAITINQLIQFVATIMELKARAGTIFRNCEKFNDGNPRKRW